MLQTIIDIKFDHPDFARRVIATVALAAREILDEDPKTSGHEDRQILAEAFIREPGDIADRIAWLVATYPAVLDAAQAGAALADDLIRAAVDRAIMAHAGPLVACAMGFPSDAGWTAADAFTAARGEATRWHRAWPRARPKFTTAIQSTNALLGLMGDLKSSIGTWERAAATPGLAEHVKRQLAQPCGRHRGRMRGARDGRDSGAGLDHRQPAAREGPARLPRSRRRTP